MQFLPAERFVLMILAVLLVFSGVLGLLKGIRVDWLGYTTLSASGLLVIAVGQFYRLAGRDARISAALTATGLFTLFTIAGSVFNYTLLPVAFTPIDLLLVRIDAALGFNWPALVVWVSGVPAIGFALRVIYFTSLFQMVLIILALSFRGEILALHRFLVTGVLGALLSIASWTFFPSFGASSIYGLPQHVLDAMPIAVGPAYGAELLRLAQEGVDYVTPRDALGLIGFPSVHMLMACISIWFLATIRILRVPVVVLNLLMVPAILVQGGHHLSDVLGGILVFAIAYALSCRIVDRPVRTVAERAPTGDAHAPLR